jgi:hypothetical protein
MNKNILLSIYKIIVDYCPPKLLPAVLKMTTVIRFAFLSQEKKSVLNKWSALRDSKNEKTAIVFATGPSIKQQNIEVLAKYDSYSVSNFYLHEKLSDINPQMHFFAPYHEPLIYTEFVDWWRDADKKLPKNTAICLSYDSKAMVEKENLFQNRKIRYMFFDKSQYGKAPNPTKSLLSPQSSPLMVLPVLIWMGYSKIVLVGCDHNILKNYGGSVDNFYKNSEDPRSNATTGANWRDGIVSHLTFAKNVFSQYHHYLSYANKNGIKLINVSPDSWLDFISYVDYKEIEK